jgi:malonyl-CoA decarboxylase
MLARNFVADLLQTISDRGRELMQGRKATQRPVEPEAIVELARELLSHRGEASGVALAAHILQQLRAASDADKRIWIRKVAEEFGEDQTQAKACAEAYIAEPTRRNLGALHRAAEPQSQELIRRLNLAPGGTLALVRLRETLLDMLAETKGTPEGELLESLDLDFVHLFSSWFNRGFLVLKRIDWSTPANILERIIRYEAVHAISDWSDLRSRLEPVDRRCFAFFHPALGDELLIFVEVALVTATPGGIAPILDQTRTVLDARTATTAAFYSISNCQAGLAGVSFGSFLIKQVAEDLHRELPSITDFVTLSPVPGFARWLSATLADEASNAAAGLDIKTLSDLFDRTEQADGPSQVQIDAVETAAMAYFTLARTSSGQPVDPVARFHLGNGARLERINPFGDVSAKGLRQARGLMVNYRYELSDIEANHEAYVRHGTIAMSDSVSRKSGSMRRSLRNYAPPNGADFAPEKVGS